MAAIPRNSPRRRFGGTFGLTILLYTTLHLYNHSLHPKNTMNFNYTWHECNTGHTCVRPAFPSVAHVRRMTDDTLNESAHTAYTNLILTYTDTRALGCPPRAPETNLHIPSSVMRLYALHTSLSPPVRLSLHPPHALRRLAHAPTSASATCTSASSAFARLGVPRLPIGKLYIDQRIGPTRDP
jgi:hypothetical protein